MTDLLYNAKIMREHIKTLNIISRINSALHSMVENGDFTTIIKLTDYSKNEIISAKSKLEENGFKVALLKDPVYTELFLSMILTIPKD